MAEVTESTPLLLAQYIVAALQRKIIYQGKNIDSASVFISATEIDSVIEAFGIFPLFVVVPGPTQPDGDGHGAQDGGSLIRRQHYTIHVYQKFNLDRRGISQQQIIQQTIGLLDIFEQVRDLFALVMFGNADGTDCLLCEPMRYEGELGNIPVDPDLGIVRRDLSYSCPYGTLLPNTVTLTLADLS